VDDSVGVLARPCDGESMAEAIASLYDRDIEAVGAAARARVLKHFTWMQAFTAQVNAYTSLVGARRIHVPARPAIGLGSPTP
jgi:alpha-1,6-mannosyltransferase